MILYSVPRPIRALARGLLLIALALGCAAEAAAAPGTPRLEAATGGVSAYRLDNGFKIILAPYPSASTVRVELLVKTGSKLEGYGETGMAHLLEHMLFKGAGKRASLKSDLTALGASWNGTTAQDRTNFFETVPADPRSVDEALRIEADRFLRAGFTAGDLKSEMTVVRNELERGQSNPDQVAYQALQRQSFFWHGYGRPTIGARSDVEDAPFSALQAFHQRNYRPDNAALIVTGNFDPQRVLKLAASLFAPARNPAAPPVSSWTREERRAVTNRSELFLPAGRTLVYSGWRLPGALDRQSAALDLASAAICSQDWGSLRKDLVLERKLAVAVGCYTDVQKDYSLFAAFASAGPDADAEALSRALWNQIEAAAKRGVSQAELDRARQEELNAYERIEASHESLASQLSQAEVFGDWRLYFQQRDQVKQITVAEANAALAAWVVDANRSDVLLRNGEPEKAPEVAVPPSAASLVAGKDWPSVVKASDPMVDSVAELAKAARTLDLPTSLPIEARAAYISRKPQGELAWIQVSNDYGNEAALSGRNTACALGNGLLAYGGAGLDRDALNARLEKLQARWTLGLEGISLEAPRRTIFPALDLLLSVWAEPALPEAEFDRLKAASVAGLEQALKDPAAVASSQAALRFDNYPEGHPLKPRSLEQRLAEAKAVDYRDAKACVADFLGLARVRLALVGDFKREDVISAWDRVRKLKPAAVKYERVKEAPAPTAVDTAPIAVAMPDKPNATVTGSALLPLTDSAADFPALRIAIKVLGGDADSRIWQRLREKEGLAYGAGVTLVGNSFEPRSRVILSATAASDKAEVALASLKDELAKALKDGFSDEEVDRAKRNWRQERRNSLRSERGFVGSLASGLYDGHDYAWVADYDERIAKVSAADATAALRKYLGAAPLVWAVGKGSK